MSIAGWTETVLAFVQEHPNLIGLLVFLLGFGESIVLISLFVPSSILFLGIGSTHGAAGGEFWLVWLCGAAGAWIGDMASYGAGRYFREDAAKVWPISRYPELIPRGRAVIERWGMLSVIAGKFIGGLRPFIPVVAGTLGMPWLLFVAASAASCLLWAGAFLGPGYGIVSLLR
jgi:membrane protein DedA with SNARE-associated domain